MLLRVCALVNILFSLLLLNKTTRVYSEVVCFRRMGCTCAEGLRRRADSKTHTQSKHIHELVSAKYCLTNMPTSRPPPPHPQNACGGILVGATTRRDRLLRSDQASVETPGGSNKLWALDIERFRSIFRLVLRGNEIVGESQMDGFSEEVALRAKAMDILIGIEKKEQEAGLKRQMAYRSIAHR